MKKFLYSPLAVLLTMLIFQASPWCAEQQATMKAPEFITIGTISNLFNPVDFNHQLHIEYAACSECHHHTTGSLPSRPHCATCHNSRKAADLVACRDCHLPRQDHTKAGDGKLSDIYHIDIPGLIGVYHLSCIDCHETIGTGPTECVECHTMTAQGEHFYQIDKAKTGTTTSPASSEMKTE